MGSTAVNAVNGTPAWKLRVLLDQVANTVDGQTEFQARFVRLAFVRAIQQAMGSQGQVGGSASAAHPAVAAPAELSEVQSSLLVHLFVGARFADAELLKLLHTHLYRCYFFVAMWQFYYDRGFSGVVSFERLLPLDDRALSDLYWMGVGGREFVVKVEIASKGHKQQGQANATALDEHTSERRMENTLTPDLSVGARTMCACARTGELVMQSCARRSFKMIRLFHTPAVSSLAGTLRLLLV